MAQLPDLQAAFILHARAYRDTSLLVDFFAKECGRIAIIARGARRAKSRQQGLLQPFTPVLASWSGRGELQTLRHVEGRGLGFALQGKALLSGLYLNELLMRLLPRGDEDPGLFALYEETLVQLLQESQLSLSLRLFEKYLLECLGYAVPLDQEVDTGLPVMPEVFYHFEAQRGLQPVVNQQHSQTHESIFLGKSLLDLHNEDLSCTKSLRDAKRLLRLAIAPHLGHRPLKARDLMTTY